jgi:DNA-3-methyladenine glycosylase II
MGETQYFRYGEKEIDWLKMRDKVLGAAMDEIGQIHRMVIPDLFMALVHAIIGQQISTKAHTTVWERLLVLASPLTPVMIASMSAEELQSTGITMKKAVYIKEMTNSIIAGRLNLNELYSMPDDDVCGCLSRIKGVGVWTAEMVMTFSMQRPDIMSWGDLAIHRGLRMLYRHHKITPALFTKYKRRYSPYATVASLYLWAIAGGACSNMSDPSVKSTNAIKVSSHRK